MLGSFRTEVKF